jgi:hypothetical protein
MSLSFLNLLTREDITAPEMGRAIGALISRCARDIFPDRIGNWEPLGAACASPEDFARHWQWPVLATKKSPRVDLSVWFRKPHRRYSSIHFGIAHTAGGTTSRCDFLAELATLTNADFGMLQELSPDYRAHADQKQLLQFADKLKRNYFLSLTDESLANGLPDAFDVMWLPPKVWAVDAEKLFAPRSGIFILPGRDSRTRDEALSAIRMKGVP